MTSSRSHHQSARDNGRFDVRRDDSPTRHRLQDRRTGAYCDELDAWWCDAGRARHDGTRARFLLLGVQDALVPRSRSHGRPRRTSFATVDSWLVWWLSAAPRTSLLTEPSTRQHDVDDLATMSWSNTMTTLFDVDPAMLATIQPSLSNFATVSADVVPELAGVPITGSSRPTVGALRSGLLSPAS